MRLPLRYALQYAAVAAMGVALALGAAYAALGQRSDGAREALLAEPAGGSLAELRAAAEGPLSGFAAAAAEPLLDGDRAALAALAARVVAGGGAVSARVYDRRGRPLGQAGAAASGLAPPGLASLGAGSAPVRWREGSALFSARAVCISGACLGAAAIGVDASALDRVEAIDAAAAAADAEFDRRALIFAAIAVSLASLAAGLIGWLLGRRLTRAIEHVVEGLEAIAEGRTDFEIEPRDAQLAAIAAAAERVSARLLEAAHPDSSGLEALAGEIPDAMFVARADGEVVAASPELHELLRADGTELVGECAFELFGLPRLDDVHAFARAIEGLRTVRARDGTEVPVIVSARVAGDAVEARVVGVLRDGQPMLDAERRAEQAERRAEAAEKAKHEFLSVMSHELRTPLNGILGGAAVLSGGDLDDGQRTFVQLIQNSGKNLLTMVSDMLNLAKMDAGEAEIDPVSTSLDDVALEILAAVQGDADAKGIELRAEIAPGLPIVLVDREKLLEIGESLAENAVKFTEEGAVTIGVASRVEAGRASITLTVADTGVGIAPDKLDAIFESFSQSDASDTRAHGGAGLGLAITKRLTELLGGEISVVSAPGEGSTFTVSFDAPLDAAAEQPDPPKSAIQAGMRALVVAPTKRERETMAHSLRSVGCDVAYADTAAKAATMLAEADRSGAPFELVIHPADLPNFSDSGLSGWLRNGKGHGEIASLVLGDERELAALGELPARVAAAPLDASPSELLRLASAAMLRARELRGDDDGATKPASAAAALDSEAPEPNPSSATAGRYGEDGPSLRAVETAAPDAPHVVLVDGNEVNRIVLGSFFKRSGYVCHLASSGDEALRLYREHGPRLVLMDAHPGGMSGLDAARAIRAHETAESIAPSTIMGLCEPTDAARMACSAAGMNDAISKPVKLDELKAKLERWTMLFGGASEPKRAAAG